MVFLDNLKIFLTCLVIVHHTGQAYGPTGGFWYYTSPDRVNWLGRFFLMNASYFMGLFFFLSGYFMPGAFDRHGAGRFVRDRLMRFGIPLLFAMFVMLAFEMYVYHLMKGDAPGFFTYYIHAYLGAGEKIQDFQGTSASEISYGHLWYVLHLLIYSLFYAGIRLVIRRKEKLIAKPRFPKVWMILVFILVLGVVTDIVRNPLGYKIDKWVIYLGFIGAEVAHIPQYFSFFILGIVAYRRKWVDAISTKVCYAFFAAGIAVVLYYWIGQYYIGKKVFEHWELKEAILAVGFSLGLIAVFKNYFNSEGELMKKAASSAYAAYVFHVPVVLSLQVLSHYAQVPALVAFILVSALGVVVSFGIGYAVCLIPSMRRIF
jgi:glucans biosynthesis protein C